MFDKSYHFRSAIPFGMLMKFRQKSTHIFIEIRLRKFKYIRIKHYYTVLRKKRQNEKMWNRNKGENVISYM